MIGSTDSPTIANAMERLERPERRVLIFRETLLPRFERYIVDQADALRRWRPLFAGCSRTPWFERPAILLSDRGRTLRGEAELKLFRRLPGAFATRLRDAAPDLIHAHFGPDGFVALPIAKKLGRPLVVTFHGFDATMRPSTSWQHFLWNLVRPRVLHRATTLVAVSEYIAERLRELGAPDDSVRVCHLGIDTTFFTPSDRPKAETVLCVARLIESKGIDVLIDAMARVQQARPALELLIMGDGPLRQALQSRARDVGARVRFLGPSDRETVRQQLRESLIFCLPAVRARSGAEEALGLSILEAQACGAPVIATRTGGIPEAVAHEATGLLVEPGDAVALGAAIERLAGDSELRARLTRDGRDSVSRRFNLAGCTAALEVIYDEAAGGR